MNRLGELLIKLLGILLLIFLSLLVVKNVLDVLVQQPSCHKFDAVSRLLSACLSQCKGGMP